MPQLTPHIFLRCAPGAVSVAAIALRVGGYSVTKVDNDDALMALSAAEADVVVIEAPILSAVATVRRMAAEAPSVPLLAISTSPTLLGNLHPSIVVMPPIDVADRIVQSVDRVIADHERLHGLPTITQPRALRPRRETFQKSRDVRAARA